MPACSTQMALFNHSGFVANIWTTLQVVPNSAHSLRISGYSHQNLSLSSSSNSTEEAQAFLHNSRWARASSFFSLPASLGAAGHHLCIRETDRSLPSSMRNPAAPAHFGITSIGRAHRNIVSRWIMRCSSSHMASFGPIVFRRGRALMRRNSKNPPGSSTR